MNATLKSYILSFRVAELQQCLQELGLSKKGLKSELQARLFAYFGEASSVAGRGTAPPREQHRLDSACAPACLPQCSPVRQCSTVPTPCVLAASMITRIYCRMKGLPGPADLRIEDIPTAG
jgi:hypothetical protein